MRSMRWFEKLLKSRLLYTTKDAITEHDITISISAALDDRFGDRLAIETVPGVYKTVEEFNEACEEELERLTGGLYNFMILPLKDAIGFSNVLSEFIEALGRDTPISEAEILVEEAFVKSPHKKDAVEITRNHLLRALDEPAVLARLVTDSINPHEVEEYLSEHILPYLRESKKKMEEEECRA